jgi:hypothetical protein
MWGSCIRILIKPPSSIYLCNKQMLCNLLGWWLFAVKRPGNLWNVKAWSSESSGIYCRVINWMSTDVQLITRQYIPEESELHTGRRENLKSHIKECLWCACCYSCCHGKAVEEFRPYGIIFMNVWFRSRMSRTNTSSPAKTIACSGTAFLYWYIHCHDNAVKGFCAVWVSIYVCVFTTSTLYLTGRLLVSKHVFLATFTTVRIAYLNRSIHPSVRIKNWESLIAY